MMNLEQFYGIEWPINFSQAEEDLFNRKWNHPTGFNKLDSILASEKEIDNLCTVLEKMEDSSFDLLKTPSLREFEFTSRETGPVMNPVMTIVRYKETALPKMPFVITPEDDTSKMSQQYQKSANLIWYEIYDIVKENCTEPFEDTPNDTMEFLLRARRK